MESSWVSNASMVLNQGKTGPLSEFKLKVPVPCVQWSKQLLGCTRNTYLAGWVNYINQCANENQLRGRRKYNYFIRNLTMLTQTRGYPGTSGIYRAGVVNRRPRNLSNGLDNAFV